MDTILGTPMFANRRWIDKAIGFDSMLLSDDEIDHLRPAAYVWYAQQIKQATYIKVHDAYSTLKDNSPLIPSKSCLGAIYIIRNPLDVAVSLAHHVRCPIDWSIHMMGDKDFVISIEANKNKQLRQKLFSWSLHVQSWVSNPTIKILVLRYEDMFYKPLETFSKGMEFLNLDVTQSGLEKAIEDASFNKLQQYEKRFGFKEKPNIEGQFFRKGIVGDWKKNLNETQVQRIIHDHASVMRTYGYLDADNQLIPD